MSEAWKYIFLGFFGQRADPRVMERGEFTGTQEIEIAARFSKSNSMLFNILLKASTTKKPHYCYCVCV